MAIKSQQDIKNEQKAKSDKIPPSMENKVKPVGIAPLLTLPENQEPEYIINERRITAIEAYLGKVDQAFEKVAMEIENLKGMIKVIQSMDVEISKLTGDIVRLTKLEEDRYIELATAINHANEKITTLDEYIPVFIDKRIEEYFSVQDELTDDDLTEPAVPEDPPK
jgi:hypothetical protein